MGGLLHLVQWWGDWAGPQPAQFSPRCTKCNAHPSAASVSITALLYNGQLLCGFNVAINGLAWSLSDSEPLRVYTDSSDICRLTFSYDKHSSTVINTEDQNNTPLLGLVVAGRGEGRQHVLYFKFNLQQWLTLAALLHKIIKPSSQSGSFTRWCCLC